MCAAKPFTALEYVCRRALALLRRLLVFPGTSLTSSLKTTMYSSAIGPLPPRVKAGTSGALAIERGATESEHAASDTVRLPKIASQRTAATVRPWRVDDNN